MANRAEIKAVITAEDRASGVLRGFAAKVEGVGSAMAGAIKSAALALGAATVAATTFAVKSAASFEQTRIGLENMLGSADTARALLEKISKFAAETPFEFPELAQATRQLVAFGFSADEAFDTMKQLGNVSAAVGAPINDLAYLMGTLKTQGRAFTIDLRQFAQRGIPIYQELGKVLKVNGEQLTAMIEDGKVGFPEVQKAFENLAGTSGRWGNTMERQSKSVNGLWSTFKDTIGQTARELVGITQGGDIKEGSLFDRLGNLIEGLNRNLPTFIANMKTFVQEVVVSIKGVVDYLTPGVATLTETFVRLAKTFQEWVLPSLNALADTFRDRLWPQLKQLWDAIEPGFTMALRELAKLFGVILVVSTWVFINAINAVVSALGFVIRVVSDVITWLGQLWGFFYRFAQGGIAQSIRDGMKDVFNIIVWPFKNAFNEVARLWNGTVGKISFKAPDWVPGIGGKGFNMPQVPLLAEGGIVTKPTLAMIGEAGPEAVVPLNKAGGMGAINITVQAGAFLGTDVEARKFATIILQHLKEAAGSKNMTVADMMGL